MEIKDILSPDRLRCAVKGTSKKRILETLSEIAATTLPNTDPEIVFSSLMCREKLGSTGIGHGIALPHGRLAGLDRTVAMVVTCKPAIAFDAIDNQPVDIFFAILVPEGQTDGHLQTLATIAGKLNNKDIVKKLRKAESSQAMYEILV